MAENIRRISDWLILPGRSGTGIRKLRWLSALLVFVTLETAILSIEQAHWLNNQPSLTLVLAISLLTGLILAESRLSTRWKWGIASLAGAVITVWQTSTLLPPSTDIPWMERFLDALKSSWQVVSMSAASESSIHFAIFLIVFTWLLGCLSVWLILSKQNAWAVVFAGGAVILLNLSNLPENYHGFLFLYMLAASLLIGHTRLVNRRLKASAHGQSKEYSGTAYFVITVFCICLVAATISWLLPRDTVKSLDSVSVFETTLAQNVHKYFYNFFSRVPRKEPFVKASDQEEYFFSELVESSSDEVHYIISSESPRYWRTRAYDIYTSSGWKNSPLSVFQPENETGTAGNPLDRTETDYSVDVRLKTDMVLVAGEFISADIPTNLFAIVSEVAGSLPDQYHAGTAVGVVTPRALEADRVYSVAASVISASPAELSDAGDKYPPWIEKYFLQLPGSLPERVRLLSANITGNASSPYEKALAISANISVFNYSLEAGPPPEGADGVDDFLFDRREGACADFASAMTVLLRAAGVPARFSIGYRTGEWNSSSNRYTIRADNRHAWTEVFFPGFGWVEFEATPGSAIPRGIVGVEAISTNGTRTSWDEYMEMQPFSIPYSRLESGIYSVSRTSASSSSPASSRSRLWTAIWTEAGIILLLSLALLVIKKRINRLTTFEEKLNYETEIYAGMCELAALAGLGPRPQQTVLEYSGQLIKEFPLEAEPIKTIVRAFVERRYGRKPASPSPDWELVQSRRKVFTAIRERLSRNR